LKVLQTTKNEGSDEQYNLGVQSEEGFVTNFDASVSITYNSHDGVRYRTFVYNTAFDKFAANFRGNQPTYFRSEGV